MPQYAYRAKDSGLKEVGGTIEADSETSAINRLGGQGIYLLSITEIGRSHGANHPFSRRRISVQVLAQTTRQLADLLGGGLPLLGALSLLSKQTEHAGLRGVIESLTIAVREGRALGDALADHADVFPPLYVSMVRASEVSGTLEQALGRLADLGERDAELRGQIISASAYPLFVLFTATAMTIFLMAYVIPALSQVFVDSGQLLPLPTRILLGISQGMTQWWWAIGLGLVGLVWFLRQWHASAKGRAAVDRALLIIPGIGTLTNKLETARFVRNLGVMLSQGVPALQALDVVSHSVGNAVVREAVSRVREAVQDGAGIAAALTASKAFPAFVSNMVAVGEESGTIDVALLKVATTYERDIDRTIRVLTTILEPVLLVLVGGVVMFIVLAMLLPIFQIGLVVQ